MREFFYNGHIRLDWGFGNPNVTGSFIALIMLATWMMSYLPREWGKAGFWIALAANGGLGVCLIQTFSRGATIAWVAGAAVLVVYAPRPWHRGRLIAVIILSAGLMFYATKHGFSERTMHGISGKDRSVTNRWLIYKVIPRMAWDAPEGWGNERGAEAFRQWYQPTGRTETYGRLVNSHATWLVEWPWYLRLGYGLAWMVVLCHCVPVANMRFSPPLALWTSFGLGACFTTIAHHWQLWLLPGVSFILLLVVRLCLKSWPGRRLWKSAGGAWALSVLTWWTLAMCTPSQVRLIDGMVIVRGQEPSEMTVLVLGIDETVMGNFYGHRIRERCATTPLQMWIRWGATTNAPSEVDVCVLAGKVTEQVAVENGSNLVKSKRWLLLNPDQPSSSFLKFIDVEVPSPMIIQIGSLAGGSGRSLWESLATRHSDQIKINEIPGKGRFIWDWCRTNF